MANLIGKSIGRYHILEQLGQGGMAVVYKAFDTRLEREVAVKIIRKDAFPAEVHERVLKRFEREAKSLAKLSHASIVKVYDYGEYEGAPYLVMELLSGGTLKKIIGQPIPYLQAAYILEPIARALAYAHEQGIYHRDVKPANILITPTGEPVLTDFGIAKLLESEEGQTLTGTGVGVGTPEYMAPEQGLGKNIDGRADIYSLGIVFYELLTGKKPYIADTPLAVLLKQVNDPLPRASAIHGKIPQDVERVLFKALAKEPKDRYQTADDFAQALEKIYYGKPLPTKNINHLVELSRDVSRGDDVETIDGLETDPLVDAKSSNKPYPRWLKWLVAGSIPLMAVLIYFGFFHKSSPPQGQEPTVSIPSTQSSVTSTSNLALMDQKSPTSTITVQEASEDGWNLGGLIYEEDFEDGIANGFLSQWGAFHVEQLPDGNHAWRNTLPSSESLTLPISTYDYAVEAKILQKSNGKGFAFIEIRTQDDTPCATNYSGYLDFYQDWVNLIERGNQCDELRQGGLFDYAHVSLFPDTWYSMRIEAKGNRVRLYIDDKLVAEDSDSTTIRESNRIALSTCCDDLMPFTFYYDDIKVWIIEP